MEKLQQFMEEHILPVATKIASQRHLLAMRDGMTILISLSILGGLSLVVAVPPIPADTTNGILLAIKEWCATYGYLFSNIYYVTIGIVSIYVTAGVSFNLAKSYGMNGITNMASAIFVFMMVAAGADGVSLQTSGLGGNGMFMSIVIAMIVVEVNRFFLENNITIKLPDAVPPNVSAPFTILIPTIINAVLFTLLNLFSIQMTGSGLINLIYTILQPLISAGDGLPFILFAAILSIVFWFFGIHGGNMTAVFSPIVTMNLALNSAAYANNTELPKIWVGNYIMVFGDQVGYMAMIIAIFIACRSARLKSVSKVAVLPAVFQITEPLTFGLPTVLNVVTVIPIIICTVINLTTSYLLMSSGIIGKFFVALPFTVPGPLNALLSTMDFKAMILWFILLALNILIMIPFMKVYDKQVIAEEKAEIEQAA